MVDTTSPGVMSVTAGPGLTGGAITGSGTIGMVPMGISRSGSVTGTASATINAEQQEALL